MKRSHMIIVVLVAIMVVGTIALNVNDSEFSVMDINEFDAMDDKFEFFESIRLNETANLANSILDESACVAAGGSWQFVQSFFETCVLPYADASESCTSSTECDGGCFAHDFPTQESGVGMCRADTAETGCFGYIEDNKIKCVYDDIIVLCSRDSQNSECLDLY